MAMRALVVSPTLFFPPQAGNRRLVKNRLEQFRAAGWSIDFVYVAFEGEVSAPPEDGLVDRFFVVPFRWPANRNPVLIDIDWLAQGLRLPEEVLIERYDVLLVNYVFCSFAAMHANAAVVVLETHDRFGNRHEILAAGAARPSWISATVPAEAEAVARADIVAILREDDRAYYEALSDRPVMLLRHAEAPRAPWPESTAWAVAPLRFGFVGSSNSVNQTALHGLLAAMGRAGERLGAIRLQVFGGICNDVAPEYRDFCVLRGVVDSDTELYNEFDVLVNPVFAGTGIKIKTVEALAFGKPVLSGAEGAAGFPVVPPHMALPSADAVVDLMIELAAMPARRAGLLAEAKAAFEAYLEATRDNFAVFLAAVAGGPTPRRQAPGAACIRWGAMPPAPDALPNWPVWDLLRRSAEDVANLVSVETLAAYPLARDAYLPAAVAAELCGDTRRSERLLDVHLGAIEDGAPHVDAGAAAIAKRIRHHPVLHRAGAPDPQAQQRYRRILAGALTAGREETSALRAELRALMRGPDSPHAILPEADKATAWATLPAGPFAPGPASPEAEDAPEERPLPELLPVHEPRREPDAPGLVPELAWTTPPALPAAGPTVDLAVQASDDSAHFQRVDVGVLSLLLETGGSLPYLFLKFLCFEGIWLLEIHPNNSPGAFSSAPDAWDEGDWGPTLKLLIDAQLMPTLEARLEPADAGLLATALRAVRARLDATEAPADGPIAQLRRVLGGSDL